MACSANAEQAVDDSLLSYATSNVAQAQIKAALLRYRDAYTSCDRNLLRGYISKSYGEAILQRSPDQVRIVKLSSESDYGPEAILFCQKVERKIRFRAFEIKTLGGGYYSANAFVERSTRYFDSISLEVFRFLNDGDKYTLKSHVMLLMQPSTPSTSPAEIIFVDTASYDREAKALNQYAPEDRDIWVAKLESTSLHGVRVGTSRVAALVAIRDPVTPGDKIVLKQTTYDDHNNLTTQIEKIVEPNSVQPFFLINASTRITTPGLIKYEITRDNKVIYTKILPVLDKIQP
jgi:hypothetical protein